MFQIYKSIDIDFAHIVAGHPGACINVHGHTWKFELCIQTAFLDPTGFVIDFKELKQKVLEPVHTLLDHSFACGPSIWPAGEGALAELGKLCMSTRPPTLVPQDRGFKISNEVLNGASNVCPGGIKVAVFPFNPTSEKLAGWFGKLAQEKLFGVAGVEVAWAKVYETLHPVESVAVWYPPK